jgi:hypothetical protein
MKEMTLEDVLNLMEVDSLPVPEEEIPWVIESTKQLVERNGEEWVRENRGRLLAELEFI